MRDSTLWRKESHIIMLLAETLGIDAEQALEVFYSTQTYERLSDPQYGLQLMSDQYIVDNVLTELKATGAETKA